MKPTASNVIAMVELKSRFMISLLPCQGSALST
jgi:hypothetical protein